MCFFERGGSGRGKNTAAIPGSSTLVKWREERLDRCQGVLPDSMHTTPPIYTVPGGVLFRRGWFR